MAYNTYDPIGNVRFDYLFARLAYTITMALHPKSENITLETFMPKYGPFDEEGEDAQNSSSMLTKIQQMTMRMGGKIIKKKP